MTTRQKKVAGILAIASMVLVWRVYVLLTDYLPSSAQGSPTDIESLLAVVPVEPAAAPGEKDATRWATQVQLAERPWGRDPFEPLAARATETADRPVGSQDAPPPPFKLSGVSRADGQWRAIVGGRIVAVGDILNDAYEVTAIGMDSITVTSGDATFKVGLGLQSRRVRTPDDRAEDGPAPQQQAPARENRK